MINERNFDRVRGMLEKTKGRIVFGGENLDRYIFLIDPDEGEDGRVLSRDFENRKNKLRL